MVEPLAGQIAHLGLVGRQPDHKYSAITPHLRRSNVGEQLGSGAQIGLQGDQRVLDLRRATRQLLDALWYSAQPSALAC